MKIGIDIGGSHVGIGLIDTSGKIIAKEEQDLSNSSNNKEYKKILIDTIINGITKILDDTKTDMKKVSLLGIAVPGTVSDTHIVKAENLHISNFNITAEINKYFNIPIVLRNDAKCAAIAEKEYGSLKKYDDCVFLTLGTGVGGAVFINGKLLRPKKYEGFEIGHMVIEKDGIECNCGRKGCFEKYASMNVFKNEMKEKLNNENLHGEDIKKILENGENEKITESVVNEYIENLCIGLANLINMFEPEVISIGGSFVYFKDIMLDKISKTLEEKNMLFNNGTLPKIVTAKLKNDAGIIGSVIEYND